MKWGMMFINSARGYFREEETIDCMVLNRHKWIVRCHNLEQNGEFNLAHTVCLSVEKCTFMVS